jgi:hypothetical protein
MYQASMLRRTAALLLLSIILTFTAASCQLFAPKDVVVEEKRPPYEPLPNALSNEYFHSPTGDIVGHFPKGWLQVNVENDPDLDQILFIYTDAKRANGLVLTEVPGSAEVRRLVERDGLVALTQESFRLKAAKSKQQLSITRQPEIFTLASDLFASYEYSTTDENGSKKYHRAVVFTTGDRFYELAMVQLNVQSEAAANENFRLLQSVIGALEGVAEVKGV